MRRSEQPCRAIGQAIAGFPVPSGRRGHDRRPAGDGEGAEGDAAPHRRRAHLGRSRRRRRAGGDPAGRRAGVRALHGLSRTLVHNMVAGVTQGYSKTLEIVGTGYRVQARGSDLEFALGYSPPGAGRGTRRHHVPGRGARPVSRSRASTSSRSARSPRTSASCASPTRTRARACGTRARSSAARPGRRVSSDGHSNDPSEGSPVGGRARTRVARPAGTSGCARRSPAPRPVRGWSSPGPRGTSYAQIVDDSAATTLASAST